MRPMLLAAVPVACAAPATPAGSALTLVEAPASLVSPEPSPGAPSSVPSSAGAAPLSPPAPEPPCAADADCGYDPRGDRCRADPRANRQPPLVDQGLVC